MSSEPESFLARWSRRKRAAEREAERPAESAVPATPAALPANSTSDVVAEGTPASLPAPETGPAATTEVPLPPIESLDGLRSDYQAFFQQPVAEELRRAALKKLFADPHFNQMDMLDVYVDDYTQFEPLPAAMRMRLPSARAFLLDSERAALDAAEASAGAAADTVEPAIATAGGEDDSAANPDAVTEEPGLDTKDAGADATSELAPVQDAALADAPSADDPAGGAHVLPSPAVEPRGKPTDPDSSTN
jgi:hypothetical protein